MDIEEVKAHLRERVDAAGSQLKFSILTGVSQAHVSEFLNDKAPPSDKLLTAIGLVREIKYSRRAKASAS